MKRFGIIFLTLFTTMVATAQVDPTAVVTLEVECDSWVEMTAIPVKDYVFTHWSDGSTDSIHNVQVNSDTVFIAYFHDRCGDYAELPLVNRYDWILMVNVKWLVQEKGYAMSPNIVHWYRVVGEVDKLEDPDPTDPKDFYIGEGYSFTLDKNLQQTGIYYGTIDFVPDSTKFCSGLSRTELAYFVAPPAPREVRLMPNTTTPNGTMHLVGLNPEIETHIRVYSVTGKLLKEATSMGAEEYLLSAYPMTGVFEVQVLSDEDNLVLRYLVKQ